MVKEIKLRKSLKRPSFPKHLLYTRTHEWLKVKGNIGHLGITDFIHKGIPVEKLELPEVGKEINKGEKIGSIELTKAILDFHAPVSGEIISINEELRNHPDLITEDPYGKGWIAIIRIKDRNELKQLLKAKEYRIQAFEESSKK